MVFFFFFVKLFGRLKKNAYICMSKNNKKIRLEAWLTEK